MPKNIWTYLLVTLVTVLIWIWAAGETREKKTLNALIQFTVPEPQNWIIKPEQFAVTIGVEGSQLGVRELQALLREPLPVDVSATGRQTVDLLERLKRHDGVLAAGVSVLSVEPALAEVELDQIERFMVPVKAMLPGVTAEGEIVVDPPEVLVAMPGQVRQRVGPGFAVEAAIDRTELDRLPQGVQQNQEVKLRLPEGLGSSNAIALTPSRAKLTFTVRSRTRESMLDTVRVQLASPPEDREVYLVEIEPKQLNNVTISTDAELARRIESNEVPVIALLHIGSREKEARIESKRITGFLALVPEPGGGSRLTQVVGRVGDSSEMPVIKLKITKRIEPS